MRKITSLISATLIIAATVPALGSVNIFANPEFGQSVVFSSVPGGAGNGGGPFQGKLNNDSSTIWNTFCIEAGNPAESESLVLGKTYKVLSTTSSSATATGNIVTDAAKWLYWQYGVNQEAITGTYTYTTYWWGKKTTTTTTYTYSDSYKDRTSLQEAIWHGVQNSEGESLGTSMSDAARAWYSTAVAAVAADPDAWFLDCVFVLNPGTSSSRCGSSSQAQSVLYANTSSVPEPATMVVWSLLGLAALLFSRLRRR